MAVEADNAVVGKEARVLGRIAPGVTGEVALHIRGGMETFFAHAEVNGDSFDVGEIVVVTTYEPPRSVRVSPRPAD